MKYTNNTFITSSNNISLAFIITTSILILAFLIISPLVKFKKKKWKWINGKNLVFFASIVAVIIGLIFSSINGFHKATINNIQTHRWVWDAISFVFSFGSLFVSLLLLACWLVVPFISYKMIKKFLLTDHTVVAELKKLSFVLLVMVITIGFSNIGWVFPLNDIATPLSIFKTNNSYIVHDEWFVLNKFMYDHCYLTSWYPWVFIGYFLINLMIFYTIIKIRIRDQEYLNNLEKSLNKVAFYFHIFDSFGSISCLCFISAYFLFNFEFMFIHIGYLLMILFICYVIICFILLFVYYLKYKKVDKSLTEPKRLMVISFTNHFSSKKPKVKFNAINISDVTITGIIFTIYMGFSYNFDFNSSALLNDIIYNAKMHSAAFWIQIILCGFIFNVISDNRSYNSALTKLLMAESTYSVVPGLQTGIVTWINPLFKPFSNFVNDMVYLLIK